MFNTRINGGYTDPNDPYQNMQPSPNYPYASWGTPDPMEVNNIPYPTPPIETNTAYPPQGYNSQGYAKGGEVKKKRNGMQNSPYPMLAEMIRQQGEGEDSILAHINPLEAMMLKSMGGSGTINKKTGLPQFSFWSKPGKAFKSFVTKPKRALAEIASLGGMIFGGPLGGALGGAAKEAILGRPKNILGGALSGGMYGTMIPGAARLIGGGLGSLGATGAGNFLENYGKNNMGSWMGNLGQVGGGVSGMFDGASGMFGMGGGSEPTVLSGQGSMPYAAYPGGMSSAALSGSGGQGMSGATASAGSAAAKGGSFYDKLLGNTGNFLSKPKNLLAAASVAASLLNRPKQEKPKTPEELADEAKRLEKALMLSPAERAAKEAELLAETKMQRSIARNKFLPEERLGNLDPIYRKSHTPEEQKRYGKWFAYHNNPNFSGEPMAFAEGGNVSNMMYGAEEISPSGLGQYIMGGTKGQDDKINALLSDGEFVIPSDVVADLGDGNNAAGAKAFYKLINNVRKHKRGGAVKLPPKAKPVAKYLK